LRQLSNIVELAPRFPDPPWHHPFCLRWVKAVVFPHAAFWVASLVRIVTAEDAKAIPFYLLYLFAFFLLFPQSHASREIFHSCRTNKAAVA
jgi:hypothetical protein